MRSNRPYNFTPAENWHDPTSHGPDYNNWNRWQPMFSEIPQNPRRVGHDPWLPVTERPFAVPPGATSDPYPAQQQRRPPHPPVGIVVHDGVILRPASSPRPIQQDQPPNRDESKLSPDEQKVALNKLKKQIYNPVQTKVARQVSLYFRGLNNNTTGETVKDKDNEDGKRCAVCLEDFVPKEMVSVTPCTHMFHEECITPWVTSHGSCPVCRFAICERMKQNTDSSDRTTVNNMPHDLMAQRDLISIMRAFDNTFELDRITSFLLPRLTRG